jgi:hypothetical protein
MRFGKYSFIDLSHICIPYYLVSLSFKSNKYIKLAKFSLSKINLIIFYSKSSPYLPLAHINFRNFTQYSLLFEETLIKGININHLHRF